MNITAQLTSSYGPRLAINLRGVSTKIVIKSVDMRGQLSYIILDKPRLKTRLTELPNQMVIPSHYLFFTLNFYDEYFKLRIYCELAFLTVLNANLDALPCSVRSGTILF